MISRLAPPLSLAAVGLALSGCFFTRETPRPPPAPAPVPAQMPPAAARDIPDAVPRFEPRSAYGNPPFYDVFGKRYFVLSSSADYIERGVASWYGPGFHKVRTSTGEIYDMYSMTAAHKTLPLPAYVRVTNLQNGRSVVVRVNDRGPFVGDRIIDLSYTAAAKLDMLRNGTAMVEVRSVGPASAPGDVAGSAAATGISAGAAPGAPMATAAMTAPPVAPSAPAAQTNGAAPAGIPPGAVPIAPAPVTSAPATALYVQAGASRTRRTPSAWRRGYAAADTGRCSFATTTSPAADCTGCASVRSRTFRSSIASSPRSIRPACAMRTWRSTSF